MKNGPSPSPDGSPTGGRFLMPGENCWRIERAHRLAVIVDAADYFAAVKSSMMQAKRRVLLIGWDFDIRIRLDPDQRKTSGPDKLGKFLNWVVAERPELEIFVLKWDLGMVAAFGRGTTPLFILDWITDKRMHFKLDGAHPVASRITRRSSSSMIRSLFAAASTSPRSAGIRASIWTKTRTASGRPTRFKYGPWHDATTAVDGDVARALGELGRQRWKRATGEDLDPPEPLGDPWPEGVRPTFENVDVAIARTIPNYEEQEEVREIQALYLSAIARAKRSIYMESQYFASRRIAEAIAARMSEPDAPEVVIINPESAYGWLEEEVMSSTRARLIKLIQTVDRNRRFRMFSPMTGGRQRHLRPRQDHGGRRLAAARRLVQPEQPLARLRHGMRPGCRGGPGRRRGRHQKPHHGVPRRSPRGTSRHRPETVAEASRAAAGSLIGIIEALRKDGRTLKPFEPPDFGILG
jgi:phospholipase D1/2